MNVSEIARDLLIRHEGFRQKAYLCTAGKVTIGVGRNVEDKGLSREEVLYLLHNDIQEAVKFLEKSPWWKHLNKPRKGAMISMYHNLGATRFNQFEKMKSALLILDYETAAKEMLNSRWAGQVGNRAYELADIMRKGELIV